VAILYAQAESHPIDHVEAVLTREEVVALQKLVRGVHVDRGVSEYQLGVSPRGSLMLFRAVQAAALVAGRDHVLPDDVQKLAKYVLAHRLILTSKAKYGSATKSQIIDEIIAEVRVPT
jgi:MoxR-like ATPase